VKLKYIIGILALLLCMVSTASAFSITKVNEPSDVPSGAVISVEVTYGVGQITFQDTSSGISGTWLKEFAYNVNIAPTSVETYEGNTLLPGSFDDYWEPAQSNQVDGFGTFSKVYTLKDSTNVRPTKVVVYLSDFTGTIPGNDYNVKEKLNTDDPNDGNQVAVHLSWVSPTVPQTSIKVTGGAGGITPIPEFPTIALPVAAVIGIVFVMGSRKKD
jgi:hypothetical protein